MSVSLCGCYSFHDICFFLLVYIVSYWFMFYLFYVLNLWSITLVNDWKIYVINLTLKQQKWQLRCTATWRPTLHVAPVVLCWLQIQQLHKGCFGNRWAFISVYGQICTAHAHKPLFPSFWSKFWHAVGFGLPDFLYHRPMDNFAISRLWHDQTLYYILAKSNNPRLSYSNLKINNNRGPLPT